MAENRVTSNRKVVVIGGSTGSIDVMMKVLPTLRPPLSFTLIIVLHRKNTADSALVDLLSAKTSIPLTEIDDKDTLVPGHIYLAPAGYHVLIEQDGTFSLDDSEKVNYSRPSIDVTFESTADVYGRSLIGILLSGANADGTNGLKAIKKMNGITIVQDPATAQVCYMPQRAILNAPIDYILDIHALIQFMDTL